jgi:multiple sugar transport system permease protein
MNSVKVSGLKKGKRYTLCSGIQMKLMLAPFLVLMIVFLVLPVLSSLALSFFEYDVIYSFKWIGLDNYVHMFFEDNVFPTALKNTLLFAVVTGPIGFFLSFILAWMINEYGRFTRSWLSFLFYSPALMGNAYMIWQVMFSGDAYGYVNNILLSFGLIDSAVQWLKDPAYVLPIIMGVQLWMSMGVSFLANIAGLQNVNPELYEAGAIDGIKNRWYELWYITLPYMKNILLFGAVMQIAASFSVGTICMTMAGFPSVQYSAETLVTHLMDVGTMRYEMGLACAISAFLFMMMLAARWLIGKIMNSLGR